MGTTGHGALIFTRKIIAGEEIELFNHGQHSRDFTYVDDIVEGVIRVTDRIATENPEWDPAHPDPATSNAPYRVYNIGSNDPTPLLRFIDVLENTLGIEAKRTLLPMQPGDVEHTYADVNDLIRDVGYQPTTKIEDGVAAFVRWYKDYYNHTDIAHNLN
jgi:UDP-glucuronate 4-epimerase